MKIYERIKMHDLFLKNLKKNPFNFKGRPAGYTLVELIIVVSIMAVLFSIGTVNYREYARNKELSNAALLLRGDLRIAQEYALGGRKPNFDPADPADNACELGGATLDYYIFERIPQSAAAGTGYQIKAKCSNTTDNSAVSIKSVDLNAKGIAISSFVGVPNSNKNRIYFYPRGKGVGNLANGSTQVTLTLSKTGGKSVTVIVTEAGEIK